MIRQPDIRARPAGAGTEVMTSTPRQTSDFLAAEGRRWSALIARAGSQLERNAQHRAP